MASPVLPLPSFDVVEICTEAAERAGVEFRSGYALITARRSLQLLSLEWSNRGLNLWTLVWDTLDLEPGVNPVALPADTIDVLDVALRQSAPYVAPLPVVSTLTDILAVPVVVGEGARTHAVMDPLASTFSTVAPLNYPPTGVRGVTDTPLGRLGSGDWANVSNKLTCGRPSQYYVNRLVQPMLYLNPACDQATYDSGITQLHYSRLRYMQPIPPGGTGVPEMPLRFINAMISGLAFHMAMKSRDPQARQQAPILRELYERDFELAADEDRERISFFATPEGMCGCGH